LEQIDCISLTTILVFPEEVGPVIRRCSPYLE